MEPLGAIPVESAELSSQKKPVQLNEEAFYDSSVGEYNWV